MQVVRPEATTSSSRRPTPNRSNTQPTPSYSPLLTPAQSHESVTSTASSDSLHPRHKAKVGLCAMDKKVKGKPMQAILDRLGAHGEFDFVYFGDRVLLEEPIERWPRCDILIAFHSSGFPLAKAIEYVRRYGPYCVNDLWMQRLLQERRLVLALLDACDIPTAPRAIIERDGGPTVDPELHARLAAHWGIHLAAHPRPPPTPPTVEEVGNDLVINGSHVMSRPFVEKPVCGDDHNINIYYSSAHDSGGGVRRLFRKVANKSSELLPGPSHIRQDASYIYEKFMRVDNAQDVKVYTIGSDYAYAETRKSPCVDGLVKRDTGGKELRQGTALTDEEKVIARKIGRAFGQTICGFDLLRVNGRSYVIDVNGWSFVKGNDDYYDRCAMILRKIFQRTIIRRRYSLSLPSGTGLDNL